MAAEGNARSEFEHQEPDERQTRRIADAVGSFD